MFSTHIFRKQKELDEARKAGTVAPEKDEQGRDINPHIPQYIAQAPWYLRSDQPSLKHQRQFNEKTEYSSEWYVISTFLTQIFSMTHMHMLTSSSGTQEDKKRALHPPNFEKEHVQTAEQ